MEQNDSSHDSNNDKHLIMLENIFSDKDSSYVQSQVDWNLPIINDEYTEEGFIIICVNQNFTSMVTETNGFHE